MASVHDHVDRVEAVLEENLIGLELERLRHDACGIREHAVLGANGIAFDAARAGRSGHACKRCFRWRRTSMSSRATTRASRAPAYDIVIDEQNDDRADDRDDHAVDVQAGDSGRTE